MPPKAVKLESTKKSVNPVKLLTPFPVDPLTPDVCNPEESERLTFVDVWSDVKKEVDHVIVEDDIEEDPDWVDPFQPSTSRGKARPSNPFDPDQPIPSRG